MLSLIALPRYTYAYKENLLKRLKFLPVWVTILVDFCDFPLG